MQSIKTNHVTQEIAIKTIKIDGEKTRTLYVLGEQVELPKGMRTVTAITAYGEEMLPKIREARQALILEEMAKVGFAEAPADMPLSEIIVQGEGVVKFPAVGDECPTCGYTGHLGIWQDGLRTVCPTCSNVGVLDQRGVDILMGVVAPQETA